MLKNYDYKLTEEEIVNGEQFIHCVVTKKDGSPFDKFRLVLDENKEYLALTMDTRFKVNLRREIEKEINNRKH